MLERSCWDVHAGTSQSWPLLYPDRDRCGIPIIHPKSPVAARTDPSTRLVPEIVVPRNLALGNTAMGNLALGNTALGNLALGNLALGNLALGNLALDIIAQRIRAMRILVSGIFALRLGISDTTSRQAA